MSEHPFVIELPRTFDLRGLQAVSALWPQDSRPIEVVLHYNQWVEPAGLTGLACLVDASRRRGGNVSIRHDGCATVGYWERMGFFREMELVGPPPSGISRAAEGRFAEMRKIADIEQVDEVTEDLVSVVNPEPAAWKTISHILSEAMNNVCQHSTRYGFSSAQYWQGTGTMRFCIADNGCGLLEALTPLYRPENDCDAIHLALKVGVTSRPPNFGQPHMRNRGVGLSCIHRLVMANGGDFDLWSGSGWFSGASGTAVPSNIRWTGTLVAATMQRSNATADFRAIMDQLTAELRAAERGANAASGRAT